MSRVARAVSVASVRAQKTRRLARWACAMLFAGSLTANTVTAENRYINPYENAELRDYGTVTMQGEGHVNAGKTANVNTLTVRNDRSVGWADGGVRLGINAGSTLNVGTVNFSDGYSSTTPRHLYVFGNGGDLNIGTLNLKRGNDALNLFSANRITVTNVNLDGGRISVANAGAVFTVTGAMSNNGGTVNVDNGQFILNAGAQYIGDAASTFNVADSGVFTNRGTFTNNNGTFTVNGTFYNNGGTVKSTLITVGANGKFVSNGGGVKVSSIYNCGLVELNNTAIQQDITFTGSGDGMFWITGNSSIDEYKVITLGAGSELWIAGASRISGGDTDSAFNINGGRMVVMGGAAVESTIKIDSGGFLGLLINANTSGSTAMTNKISFDGVTSSRDNFRVLAYGGLNDRTYILSNNCTPAGDLSQYIEDRSFLLEYKLKNDGTKLILTADNENDAFLKIKGVNRTMAEAMERMADDNAVPEGMRDVAEAIYSLETEQQVHDALDDLNSVTISSASTAMRAAQNANQAFGAFVAGEFAQKMAMDSVMPELDEGTDAAPRSSAGGVPVEYSSVVNGCENQWRGYITAIGDFGSNNSPRDVAGSQYLGFGFLTGLERTFGKDLTLGLTFSWSRHETELNRSLGDTTDDTFRLGTYGKWNYENFYVVSAPSVGLHLMDTERNIRFMGKTASGERTGVDVSWYNQAGLGIHLPYEMLFTPSVALGLTYLHDPDYTETGAGGANLRMTSQNYWSLLSNVGARLGRAFALSPKAVLLPEVWGGWEHEYLGIDDVRTMFAAAPDYAWNAPVVSIPADRAVLGAGVSTLINDRYDLGFRYEARVWSTGCDHQVSLRAGMKF